MKFLPLALIALFVFAADALAGLKIYYIRHAESGANVAKAWEQIPKDMRPAYVGNEDAFTPLGEAQAKMVPTKLSGYEFDFIAVSPKWRARQTIRGYLQQNGLKAELWPELEEFSVDVTRAYELIAEDKLPPARDDLFSGEEIKLPDDEKESFTLRDNGTKRFNLREGKDERAQDCVNSLQAALARIKQLPADGDPAVLLVGHGTSGRLLLQMLVKKEMKLPWPENTGVWMVEEQPDGSFDLKIYNDQPPPNITGSPAAAAARSRSR